MTSSSRSSSCSRSDSSGNDSVSRSSSASRSSNKHLRQVKKKLKGHRGLRHSCCCKRRNECVERHRGRSRSRCSHIYREDSCGSREKFYRKKRRDDRRQKSNRHRRREKEKRRHYKKHHHHGHSYPKIEEKSSLFVDQTCTGQQPPDSSVGIDENLAPRTQTLTRDLYLDAKISEKRKWDVCANATVSSEFKSNQPDHSRDERDWLVLSLDLVKASKPSVVDLIHDDFKLSLPEYLPSEISKVTQEIDLNVAVEEQQGSRGQSKPLQLPTTVSCAASMLHQPHSLREGLPSEVNGTFYSENFKDKDRMKHSAEVAGNCQVGTEIILSDDSDSSADFVLKTKVEACSTNEDVDDDRSSNMKNGVNELHEKGECRETVQGGPVNNFNEFHEKDEYIETVQGGSVNGVYELHEKGECAETVQGGSVNSAVPADKATNQKIKPNVLVPCENPENNIGGFKARKKRMVHRTYLPLREPSDIGDKVVSSTGVVDSKVIAEKAFLNRMVIAKPGMWDVDILCDLCQKGPSLSLGEWYSWCCGLRFYKCCCAPDWQLKLRSDMQLKKKNKGRKKMWSGRVHKMCGLWSSEVFEEDEGEQLQGLFDAVRRGKTLTCAGCGEVGATSGCRVKACRRSFHYPCADKLASQLGCRMWDGVQFPVACQGHRHVVQSCQHSKEKPRDLKKWRYRGRVSRQKSNMRCEALYATQRGEEQEERALCGSQPLSRKAIVESEKKSEFSNGIGLVIDLSSDSDDTDKKEKLPGHIKHKSDGLSFTRHGSVRKSRIGNSIDTIPKGSPSWNQGLGESRHEDCALYYMGNNLLCTDISGGREAVMLPCTNDVDTDVVPGFEYLTKNRYVGRARHIVDSLLLDEGNLARSCKGCNNIDIDNPHEEVSVHVDLITRGRDSDTRIDWQGQPMFGRLPYDCYGRLMLGTEATKIVECNSRCSCGIKCLNRELQKGLTTPLEVFKTKDRGWGVRTMEPIPRGKFVVEYVGEVLTHGEANERRVKNCMSNFSYLFRGGNPEVTPRELLVIDSFTMSNVTRLINHSCEGNLRPYRVYTEATELRCCRIGMYATCDIEIGEELSYDYKYLYGGRMDNTDLSTDLTAIKCLCGARSCKGCLWSRAA